LTYFILSSRKDFIENSSLPENSAENGLTYFILSSRNDFMVDFLRKLQKILLKTD